MKLLTNKSQYQQEQSLYRSISNQNQIFKPNWQKPIHQLKKKKKIKISAKSQERQAHLAGGQRAGDHHFLRIQELGLSPNPTNKTIQPKRTNFEQRFELKSNLKRNEILICSRPSWPVGKLEEHEGKWVGI